MGLLDHAGKGVALLVSAICSVAIRKQQRSF
jgi:hypothetical protein